MNMSFYHQAIARRLPDKVATNLKSRDLTAKQIATAFNQNPARYKKGIGYQVSHDERYGENRELKQLHIFDPLNTQFTYTLDSTYSYQTLYKEEKIKRPLRDYFYQEEHKDKKYDRILYGLTQREMEEPCETCLFESEKQDIRLVQNYTRYFSYPSPYPYPSPCTCFYPLPSLLTCGDKCTTKYISPNISIDDIFEAPMDVDVYDDPMNIPTENIESFIGSIDQTSSPMQQEFKNLFNITSFTEQIQLCNFFQDIRAFLFDEPVKFVTDAYQEMQEKPEKTKITTELKEKNGQAIQIEVQKNPEQVDNFIYILQNKSSNIKIEGIFKLLRDRIDKKPLKEDSYGKILTSKDAKYDNPENKLCFNFYLKLCHYDYDYDAILDEGSLQRTISGGSNGQRYMHNISSSYYNLEGQVYRYSAKWLKSRFLKVLYNIDKSELKKIEADLLFKKLHPEDLNIDILSTIEESEEECEIQLLPEEQEEQNSLGDVD